MLFWRKGAKFLTDRRLLHSMLGILVLPRKVTGAPRVTIGS